ncbi:MAG: hypothetical protein F6K00_29985 [Leptolyngbya sp. SIOISBB]|nr:hypothetical protein [Leptolyngbya sp. SIOISBB]
MPNPHSLDTLSPKARSLLDQALAGESDRVKSRVLKLVLEAGINPEEEFFLISLGLNHVKVLLEEAPQQFQGWSATLLQQLNAWSDSYRQSLHLIAEKAEATGALIETAGQLATLLTTHTQTCNALVRQLQSAHQAWGNSWEQQSEVNTAVMEALKALPETLNQQSVQLKALSAEVRAMRQPDPMKALGLSGGSGPQRILLYGLVCCTVVNATGLITLLGLYSSDRAVMRLTAIKVEHLLQKQNRRDCMEGIKPADSPECES